MLEIVLGGCSFEEASDRDGVYKHQIKANKCAKKDLRDPELLKESKSFFQKAGLLGSSPEFRDFIMRLICFEERHRWTFDQLLNHPWLQDSPK